MREDHSAEGSFGVVGRRVCKSEVGETLGGGRFVVRVVAPPTPECCRSA